MNQEIKNSRTADATITILKADHTPLANQEVTIEQTNHKFLFGTAAFDLVPLASGEYAGREKEEAEERSRKDHSAVQRRDTSLSTGHASSRSAASRSRKKSKTPPAGVSTTTWSQKDTRSAGIPSLPTGSFP